MLHGSRLPDCLQISAWNKIMDEAFDAFDAYPALTETQQAATHES